MSSERLIRLNSLSGKDAPRDHFTATSASPKSSNGINAQSLERETYSTKWSSVGSTDSGKAVKGSDEESPTDGRVMFDSSDKLYRRGQEAEAINVTDPASSHYFGSHFDKEATNDVGL